MAYRRHVNGGVASRTARTVAALCLMVPLVACSGAPGTLVGKPIDGQVIDADTGQPIAGAHVMYLWEAGVIPTTFSAHNAPTICYHAAAAITDAQGHFHIPAWEKAQTYGLPNRE